MQLTAAVLPFLYAFANGAVQTVKVGDGGLTFDPKTITASSGDTVIFELFSTHDVAQGDFSSPCKSSSNGFYSGPFSGTDNGKKRFVVNITSSDPIYYYCSVQKHCQSGMVGGINLPSSGDTVDSYSNAAKNVGQADAPSSVRGGQLLEQEQIASLTAGATSSQATGTPSGTASGTASRSGSGSPTGASATGASNTPASSGTGPAAVSSTGLAAGVVAPAQLGGFAAFAMGAAAWFV